MDPTKTPSPEQLDAAMSAFEAEGAKWERGAAPAGFWVARELIEVGRVRKPREYFKTEDEAAKHVIRQCLKAALAAAQG